MGTEPTPAQIDAAVEAAVGPPSDDIDRTRARLLMYEVMPAALRAVLPDHDARTMREGAQQMLDWLAARGQAAIPGWLLEQAEEHIASLATGGDHDARVRADERAKVAEEIARDIEAAEHPNVEAWFALDRAAAIARQHTTGEDTGHA